MFRACLLLALFAASDLEEAVKLLAGKIALHLAPNESPRLAVQNISSFPAADVTNVRAGLVQVLRKRGRSAVEIKVTISENLKGYLLVAEIHKSVEMVSFQPNSTPPPLLLAVSKRLIWEQPEPILDLWETGDQMLILSNARITRYERRSGKWDMVESSELTAPTIRDPRGRMELQDEKVNVFLPGSVCRGTWQPLKLTCEPGTADFTLDGKPAHFTPARNTIEGPRAGSGDAISVCGSKILASSESSNTVAVFNGAIAISEATEFPGPVTALWPTPDGALAVARNLTTNNYAAYALSVDCGR